MLDHRDYNLHVHVFGNDILPFKYPLTELLISDTNFEKAVTERLLMITYIKERR